MSNSSRPAVHLITGGAGFIGVNLAAALLARGARVVVLDDFSRGTPVNLGQLADHADVAVRQVDCAEAEAFRSAIAAVADFGPIAEVWHLAANSDIPAGVADPSVDLRRTFMTTFVTLQMMRELGIRRLNFASTGAVYGDMGDIEITENSAPLEPISNYGAMKLASEAQIRAAAEQFLDQANIFRFPNVVGMPATHGVIHDFVDKLLANPARLDVLGDGSQRKPYLHCDTLVDAMLFIRDHADRRYQVCNIGPQDAGVTVRWIAETVCALFGGEPEIVYGAGNRGWVGDVPQFRYSTERLRQLGWSTQLHSEDAVRRAAEQIIAQRRASL